MKLRQNLMVLAYGSGALAFLASGAAAEWLVTRDGSQVEIEGPWKVEGELVMFTLPNGTLGSMPLSAVDLETSRTLAEEAAAAREPAAEEPAPKAEIVITDADVGHPNLVASDTTEGGDSPPAASQPPALRVTGWRENVDLSRNSVQISGTLQNPTENPVTSIELEVQLYDEQDGLLETSRARLERGFLNPGASIRFDASFNETLSYDRVEFDIRGRGFMSNPPDDEPPAEDEEDGESSVEQ